MIIIFVDDFFFFRLPAIYGIIIERVAHTKQSEFECTYKQ